MMSQRMMPPKMFTKIARTVWLDRIIWNAVFTCSFEAPPPTSRKFAGLAAVVLDDVHRGHGEAGAVHQAADVAVERHVRQARPFGGELRRVLFVDVAQGLHSG
jgi:hypothetical protein